MKRRWHWAWLLLSTLIACGSPPGVTQPAGSGSSTAQLPPADELDQPLPLDQRVKKGKLDNGLTYYVLGHKKPEKRAQLWLVVDAGSVLEDDDQQGLAHFVEHMAFNGTKRFPKQELVDFLEKTGVRFGADLNASTSFDETVYTLQVPTDKPDVFGRALGVLRDWADGVAFEQAEVDKERGVVLEEWRRGRGARARLFDKQAPVLFHASKYAERITIGKPDIIRTASRETLVRFYKDWYRPDLMAVVAVGDFDAGDVEDRIKKEFGSLVAPAKPRPRAAVELPAHAETLVSIETDPEQPTTSVGVITKLSRRPESSSRDYRRAVAEQLFNAMLNARLDELRRRPDAPFLAASSSASGFVRSADSFRQSAVVREDGVERGFAALLEELLRVERHGFLASELDRAKAQLLRQFERAVKERDKRDGSEYAGEIVRNFLENEAMPGREAELALVQKFLPTIGLDELNALAKTIDAGSRVIAVTGPATMTKPSAEGLLGLRKDVAARVIEPYVDAVATGPLMEKSPKAGSVAKTSSIPEIGVTEWTLSNGVRVVVKPTDFANDDVRLSAFSPGGTSLVDDADYVSARFADDVVRQGGIGTFDVVKLGKLLSGKLVSVDVQLRELEEGVTGRASPTDLESLFQMIHLAFTAPRKDPSAFTAWRQREIETVKNRRLSPEQLFTEEMTMLATQNHVRRRPTTPEVLQKIDLDRALAIYKDRFGDASDFTFVIVGNVELDKLKGFVETYLASLPAAKRKETYRDVKVEWPKGVQKKTVTKGREPRSVFSLMFHGKEKWSKDAEDDVRALNEVLKMRLRQTLREDMGGVYGVQTGASLRRRPRPEYQLSVSFSCAPENVEKLQKAVFDEIEALQTKGPSDDVLSKIKEARRRGHETDLKDNGFWLREIEYAYTFGDDPRTIPDIAPTIEKITADRVKAAAKKYLSTKQYVLGVLQPEAGR